MLGGSVPVVTRRDENAGTIEAEMDDETVSSIELHTPVGECYFHGAMEVGLVWTSGTLQSDWLSSRQLMRTYYIMVTLSI